MLHTGNGVHKLLASLLGLCKEPCCLTVMCVPVLQGIPSLIILDAHTGKVITPQGRHVVEEDEAAEHFPWTPKSLAEVSAHATWLCECMCVCVSVCV